MINVNTNLNKIKNMQNLYTKKVNNPEIHVKLKIEKNEKKIKDKICIPVINVNIHLNNSYNS